MSTESAEGTRRVAFVNRRTASTARSGENRAPLPNPDFRGSTGSLGPPTRKEGSDGPLTGRTPEPRSASSSVLAPAHGFLDAVPRASIGAPSWPRLGA
jgi:hypothetical protein